MLSWAVVADATLMLAGLVSVTGRTVVDTAKVLVMTVGVRLRAGQSVTVLAQDVMVISEVLQMVDVQ